MQKRINELLQRCIENKISFDYSESVKWISIYKIIDGIHVFKSYGYMTERAWSTPEEEIERLHDELSQYLEGLNNE